MINFETIKVISSTGEEIKVQITSSRQDGSELIAETKTTANAEDTSLKLKFLEDCVAKEVIIFDGEHGHSADTEFYGDGYQKLSQYGGTVGNPISIAGYTDSGHYKMPQAPDCFTAYNYITLQSDDEAMLIGATSCNRFRTEYRLTKNRLVIAQSLENLSFKADDEIELEKMVIINGNDINDIYKLFGMYISENHPRKIYSEFPVGWCSWYCIGPDIAEKDIFKELKVIKEKLPEIKYIQIDDGFQPFMGDWLEVSDKFKRSMKEICNDIKREGFEPAIWLAPFIASEGSRLLREHPEYFVMDENGKPLCCENVTFRGWRDAPWYMLDGTNPAARQYIYDVVKTIYNEWGVKYFKLDANVWGALPFGVRYDKNATAVESYRRMMETFWEATGDDAFVLGCNAPMWPSLGLVSGMRVTNDTFRDAKTMLSLTKECFRRNWMNNVLWLNDPDCLMMRKGTGKIMGPGGGIQRESKNRRIYKLNNVYIRASGGSILSGDYIESYKPNDIALFKRLISLPKIAADFDKNLEVGTIKYDGTTEYCIFNQSNFFKAFEIIVPPNATAIDMYTGETLTPENGRVKLLLRKRDAAWIALKKD